MNQALSHFKSTKLNFHTPANLELAQIPPSLRKIQLQTIATCWETFPVFLPPVACFVLVWQAPGAANSRAIMRMSLMSRALWRLGDSKSNKTTWQVYRDYVEQPENSTSGCVCIVADEFSGKFIHLIFVCVCLRTPQQVAAAVWRCFQCKDQILKRVFVSKNLDMGTKFKGHSFQDCLYV